MATPLQDKNLLQFLQQNADTATEQQATENVADLGNILDPNIADSFLNRDVADSVIAQEQARLQAQEVDDDSNIADAASAVFGGSVSGLASGVETIFRASRTFSAKNHGADVYTKAMTALGVMPGLNVFAGLSLVSDQVIAGADAVQEWSKLSIDENDEAAAYVREVIDSTLNSIIAGMPGAVAAGATTGGFGTVAGFAASAGSLMALAEYDSFIEELGDAAKARGMSEQEIQEEKNKIANIGLAAASAGAEGIFEALGDLVQGKLIVGGLRKFGGQGVKNYLKKKFVKNFALSALTEVPSELATSAVQIEAREAAKIPTPGFVETLGHTILVTLGQTALMGGLGSVSLAPSVKKQTQRAAELLIRNSDKIDKVIAGENIELTDRDIAEIGAANELVRQAGLPQYEQMKDKIAQLAKVKFDEALEENQRLNQRISGDPENATEDDIKALAASAARLKLLNVLGSGVDAAPFSNLLNEMVTEEDVIPEDEVEGWTQFNQDIIQSEIEAQKEAEREAATIEQQNIEAEAALELERQAAEAEAFGDIEPNIDDLVNEAREEALAEARSQFDIDDVVTGEPTAQELANQELGREIQDVTAEDVAPPETVEDVAPPESEGDVVIGNEGLENRIGGSNAKTGKIFVRDDIGPLELFEYMKGKSGPASAQKKKVLDRLERQGWPMERLRNMIKNDEDARKFIALHELSHVINNDNDVYWEQGKDLLTDDKIEIETRAMFDAIRWFNQYLDEDVNAIVRFVKEEQEATTEETEVIENAPEFDTLTYSDLGNKTEDEFVKVSNKGRSPAPDGEYTAYRGPNTKKLNNEEGLIKDFLQHNMIGNPFGPYGLTKMPSDKDGTATMAFVNWILGKDHTDKYQNYRKLLLDNFGNIKGKRINYYSDLGRPSHATALSFLVNKENRPAAETTVGDVLSEEAASEVFSNVITDPSDIDNILVSGGFNEADLVAAELRAAQDREAELAQTETAEDFTEDIPEGDRDILGDMIPDAGTPADEANASAADTAKDTEKDTEDDDSTNLTNLEIKDTWEAQRFENNQANSLGKLKNAIDAATKDGTTFETLLQDAKALTLGEFRRKWKPLLDKIGGKVNWKKIHVAAQTLENKRAKQVVFVYDNKTNKIQVLAGSDIDQNEKVAQDYSPYDQRSIWDDIADQEGWSILTTTGMKQRKRKDGVTYFVNTGDYRIWRQLQRSKRKMMDKHPVSIRRNHMWSAGYVLVFGSASGKSEAWVKYEDVLTPEERAGKGRSQIETAVRNKVLDKVGFKGVRGPNVLKRGQILLKTGPIGRVSDKEHLGRNTRAVIVAETRKAYYDNGAFVEVAAGESTPNNVDVKNVHDGAIYVTKEWMDAYTDSLGIGRKAFVKSFIWQQDSDGVFAGKGAFFIAAPGSAEEAMLKKHGVDMLVYEDASKLSHKMDKPFELADETIRYNLTEHPALQRETFTRSLINMLPNRIQRKYMQMFGEMFTELEKLTHDLVHKPGKILDWIRQTYGLELSPKDDYFLRALNAGLGAHPSILGDTNSDNPLIKQFKNYIAQRVLKMPRQGFHTHFRPSDSDLAPDEIIVSEQALKAAGLKIGDEVLVYRHPLVRLDSVMKVKIKGTHNYGGNTVMLNPARYAIFSTGDFDGDSGSIIKALDFEKEFFGREEVQELVGDIPLGKYKEEKARYREKQGLKTEENIENDQDLNDMILRNDSGSSLIGGVTNLETFYNLLFNNQTAIVLSFVEDKGKQRAVWDLRRHVNGVIEGEVPPNSFVFSPRIMEHPNKEKFRKDERHIPAQDVISLYHLAATDQAKEDILFDLARQRTGIVGDPIAALTTEIFDIRGPGGELVTGRELLEIVEEFSMNPYKKDFEAAISIFRPSGENTLDNMFENIKSYYQTIEMSNGRLGNTIMEKMIGNVLYAGSGLNIATVDGSLENNAMKNAHIEAGDRMFKTIDAITPNTIKALVRGAFKDAIAKFDRENNNVPFSEAVEQAREIKENMLNVVEEKYGKNARVSASRFFDAIVAKPNAPQSMTYESISKFRHYLMEPVSIKEFAVAYDRAWRERRKKFKDKRYTERTGHELPYIPPMNILPKEKC